MSSLHHGTSTAAVVVPLTDWISDTRSQGYTDLQSLAKCLDHRGVVLVLDTTTYTVVVTSFGQLEIIGLGRLHTWRSCDQQHVQQMIRISAEPTSYLALLNL